MRSPLICAAILALCLASPLAAADTTLLIDLPAGAKIKSAVAFAPDLKLQTDGTIAAEKITFEKLLPDTPYSILITLDDGTILRGVDLSWYAPEKEPPAAAKEPLDDDDRQQIQDLFHGVKAFENKRNMLLLNANHDRATMLVELIRDTDFYSNKGGEIIWRIELWHFKNQHGGWEKLQQQNQVLYRERFKSPEAHEAMAKKFKWLPSLGGLRFSRDEPQRTITLDPTKKPPAAESIIPPPAAK